MEAIFDTPVILGDRSTIERWGNCPAQAKIIESGDVITTSDAANSGNVVHDAVSRAVVEYIDTCGTPDVGDLVEIMVSYVQHARVDVQPHALDGIRFSAWTIAKWLKSIPHQDIMRHDGGEGLQCGQLAWDIAVSEDVTVRATSELDFLYGGPSEEVVEVVDWKSGYATWTATEIKSSFQFTQHAWLVLMNYPTVNEVGVRVFNTRWNSFTGRVRFTRDRIEDYEARVATACGEMVRWRDHESPPAYPSKEKCALCDAAALCPLAVGPVRDVAEDPQSFVRQMHATQVRLDAMVKAAKDYVKKSGDDIRTPDGLAFGIQKPKSNRAPTSQLYEIDTQEEE